MKKTLLLTTSLILLMVISVLGYFYFYNYNIPNTPEKITKKYFDALQKNKFDIAYECISSSDKNELSYDSFIKKYHFDEIQRKIFLSRTIHEISKIEINEDTAKIFLITKEPEPTESMLADIFPLLLSSAFSNNEKEQKENEKILQEKLAQKLKEENIPLISKEETIEAIKENDLWFINLNIIKENKINELKREAQKYEEEKKLKKAKEKYEEIMQLQGNSIIIEATEKIQEFDKKIESFNQKQEYIKNIALKDIKVFDYKEYSFQDPTKAFKGTIINNGDKVLKEIKITVYMYDKKNNIIAEEDFYPLTVSAKPLKPNYVKDFGWKLEKYAPTAWSGKIKVDVTDIEFE